MTVPVPEGVDWMTWGVLTHERNRASLAEVERDWSLVDLLDAHVALSVHDDLAAAAADRARDQADRARAEREAASPRRRR